MDKSVKGQEKRRKLVFSLDSPYSTVEWPPISRNDQETILELLCSLISPIGQHRTLLTPSKGKRSRKRKRAAAEVEKIIEGDLPSAPEIASYVTLGLNATTARLEALASLSAPNTLATFEQTSNTTSLPKWASVRTGTSNGPLRAVFVCRSDSQPSQLHAHIPLLCGIASRSTGKGDGEEAQQTKKPVRLIQLPKGSDARLSAALGISRTGFLGLMDEAPGSRALLDFIEKSVGEITIPWLSQTEGASYHPTIIKTLKSTAPPAAGKQSGGGNVQSKV
ncbi:RNase P and RNase MRP subunit [Rhizina undulata]